MKLLPRRHAAGGDLAAIKIVRGSAIEGSESVIPARQLTSVRRPAQWGRQNCPRWDRTPWTRKFTLPRLSWALPWTPRRRRPDHRRDRVTAFPGSRDWSSATSHPAELDQREGLAVLVFMHATRAGRFDIILNEHGPVVGGHIVQTREGADGCRDVPDWTEVPGDLFLNGRCDLRQIGRCRVVWCLSRGLRVE